MFSYEQLTNLMPRRALKKAAEHLEQGWARRGYPAIDLHTELPWALRDEGERSWNFNLHSWDMLDALLCAFDQQREVRYLQVSLRIACEWARQHAPGTEGISPFAWYDMAVGLRAYRLAYLLEAARREGLLEAAQDDLLWQSLCDHASYLADDENIIFHNNHGYYQVAGQLAMGRRFAGLSPVMDEARQQGALRLQRMLEQQFTSDGIHREHSPDYHRMVYETLRGLIRSGLLEDPATLELARRIEESLSWFIQPNRRIANFGDSDHRWMGCAADEAMQRWDTPVMQHAVSAGSCGEPAPSVMAAFPEGGYFVLRQPVAGKNFEQASYLAQMCGFHSRTHKHADDLSFIWMERGTELLVDAGRYGYLGRTEKNSDLWHDGHWYSDPMRVYCESTRAHNCLEFDGRNYPRRGRRYYGSALRRWERVGELVAVESEASYFGGVRQVRLLILHPGQWLIVLDWYDDTKGQEHDARQWFHLAPALQLESTGNGFISELPEGRGSLQAIDLLSGSEASRPCLGQMERSGEPTQGWWSPAEQSSQPAWAFNFMRKQQAQGCFATLLSLSARVRAEPNCSMVNETGRKGTLVWHDAQGRHELNFNRPVSGALKLTYA